MSDEPAAPAIALPDRFALRDGGEVVLHDGGFRHPRGRRASGDAFTAYRDVTHVALGGLALRVAHRGGVVVLLRGRFHDSRAPVQLAHALLERIARLPDGAARLDAFHALDARLAHPATAWVSRALVLACALVFLAELLLPTLRLDGTFNWSLIRAGEWWRPFTSQALHGGFGHVVMNAVVLGAVGAFLEHAIGSARTGFAVVCAALGAALASAWAGYEDAVGASGVASGLFGGLLAIELLAPETLPAPWRLPRALLITVALVDAVLLPALVPFIAGAAHVGGLAGGAFAAALVVRGRALGAPPPAWLRLVNAGALVAGVAAFAVLLHWTLPWSDSAMKRSAERLLDQPRAPAVLLNNQAWVIATSDDPSPELLELAYQLARRAAELTDHRDANVLDTLAEVAFLLGHEEEAIAMIDEAIALAPYEPYFQEQRKRFTGERARDDRPDGPEPEGEPIEIPPPDPDEPRITV
jgi:membrane associated rhomboid family serine protease